ncbi:hypothetical protein PSTT_06447 [Puccinia striiformis]|uniref:Uncharacterized protein n=1 Tax=Puccinia striiformis TaxID=27350 RepID=A0A2S4VKB5_9BASI|nr:hypothetical protein PSTT_06447 [Puccinia striiformis]
MESKPLTLKPRDYPFAIECPCINPRKLTAQFGRPSKRQCTKATRQGTASPAGSGLPSSVGTVPARTHQPPNNRPRKLPPKPTKPVKRSVFHPSRNKTVVSKTPGSAATPDGEPSEVYGYDQDSEVEIEQIESKARNQKADDDNEDNFFTSRANLRTHWDGTKQAGKNNHGCKNRFALIVNGGLQALTLKILPPAKIKQLVLGFFPVLGKLPEEVNQLADIPEENEGEEAYKSDYGNADDEGSHTESESEEEAEPPQAQSVNTNERTSRSDPAQTGSARHIKSAKLRALTDQFVAGCCDQADHSLQKLPDDVPSTPPNTSEDPSVPQSTRRESSRIHTPISRPGFIRTASDSRRALIGIPNEQHRRPSITADSHPVTEDPRGGTKSDDEEVEPQATSQRRVTKKLTCLQRPQDQESMEQSRRKSRGRNTAANISQFDNVTFSPGDWQDIQELNWELEVFVRLTQEMEGNHSSGAHVIPKYLELKEDLEEKTMACLKSDALYPMYSRCNLLIQGEFARIKEKVASKAAGLLKTLTPDTQQKQSTTTDSKGLMARLALLNKKTPSAQEHELQLFLTADMTFRTRTSLTKTFH